MKERPILMNGESVLGIIDLRKTQTRRVVRGRIALDWLQPGMFSSRYVALPENYLSPYGYSGDLLWVRETWRPGAWREDGRLAIDYKASPELTNMPWITIPNDELGEKFESLWIKLTDELLALGLESGEDEYFHWEPGKCPLKWSPSIFMPRWASRLTLEIINLHIEKLNDITEADILAEGIIRSNDGNYLGLNGYPFQYAYEAYFSVWNSIYTKKGYPSDSNPWVWVIEFKPVDQPAVNGG